MTLREALVLIIGVVFGYWLGKQVYTYKLHIVPYTPEALAS